MSKRIARKPQSNTPVARDAAAPVPDAQSASLPKPRARKKTAASLEATSADNRQAPADGVFSRRSSSPSHDEIATRAYYIALERGFSSDPMADWLLAERQLTGISASQ